MKALLPRLYSRSRSWLTGVPALHYCRVTPHLYVGDQYGKRGKPVLEHEGITGTINMRIEFDDAAHGLCLTHYAHLPTIDNTAPSLEHLHEGIAFIDEVLTKGGKVYIHCAGGLGRAPTMAAAYLMSQGWSLTDALTQIKRVRPFIHPRRSQIEQLERLQAQLRTVHPVTPEPS